MRDDPLNRLSVKRGSQLPHAKLSEETAVEILGLVEERKGLYAAARALSNGSLADRYGVHKRTIEKLVAGESWLHVQDFE